MSTWSNHDSRDRSAAERARSALSVTSANGFRCSATAFSPTRKPASSLVSRRRRVSSSLPQAAASELKSIAVGSQFWRATSCAYVDRLPNTSAYVRPPPLPFAASETGAPVIPVTAANSLHPQGTAPDTAASRPLPLRTAAETRASETLAPLTPATLTPPDARAEALRADIAASRPSAAARLDPTARPQSAYRQLTDGTGRR